MYQDVVKPFFDLLFSLVILLLLGPLILLISILLALANRGKPFFTQRRPGKYGRVFTIVKFKTMNDRRDGEGKLLPDARRLTTVGKVLRKTSLDELPQLLNVLKGDMSLVGPRPLLPEYLPLYNARQARRHEVKPGITGWAQVNGRNAISWEQKFEYDVWYVQNCRFALDIRILYRTFVNVLKREGINTAGVATTQPFRGNK